MPNKLGFCGSRRKEDQKILKDFLAGKAKEFEVRKVLEKFEAAYQYYSLIAKKNDINDPFSEKVVEAYWIGNKLLDKVKASDIRKITREDFSKPGLLSKKEAEEKAKKIPKNSIAHHSFHVLVLGPIAGRIDLENIKLKDVCRVGWGRVIKFKVQSSKFKVIVEYQPLIKQNNKIILGDLVEKELNWDRDIVKEIKVGEYVAFHWGMVAQVLTEGEAENIKKYTLKTLVSLN